MTIADIERGPQTIIELAHHYADRLGKDDPVLFDLGCGRNKIPRFRGVDLFAPTDVSHDLMNGDWDFTPDNSVDMFFSSHFLEHVQDLNRFMFMAWRKLRDGGLFLITTPYGLSVRAWQDPTHVRPIFRETYGYFNRAWRERQKIDHYGSESDYDILDFWPVWNRKYATRAEGNADLAEQFMNTFNAVDDLTCLLRARKMTTG